MTTTIIVSSGTQSGLVIGAGTALYVENGGTVVDTTVFAGGQMSVEQGGVASETMLRPGVQVFVTSGGIVSETTVESAAFLSISSGGTDITTTVASGGTLFAGGSLNDGISAASGATVSLTTYVSSGVVLSDAMIGANDTVHVLSGGTLLSADILPLGHVTADSGSVVSGAVIEASGSAILNGGTAISTNVSSGGHFNAISSVVISTTVASGGYVLLSNSTNSATTTAAGGVVSTIFSISSGQSLSGLTINQGETLSVGFGARLLDMTVASGGTIVVAEGGTDFGTTVEAGGYEWLSGTAENDVIAGQVYIGSVAGGLLSGATIVNNGTVEVNPGDTVKDITIAGSGTLIDYGNISGSVTLADHGRFVFSQSSINAVVSGFNAGNSIDMLSLPYENLPYGVVSAVLEGNRLVLHVPDYGDGSILLAGDYTGAQFTVAPDSQFGTIITVSNVPCFTIGTMIETEQGPRPVEALTVGQRVKTMEGGLAPIVWIGNRTVDCRHHPAPDQIRPIMIAPDAFADGVPSRALLLSPDHAVWADGVLIPVKHLVNGTSIRPIAADSVTYFHIELLQHDVIFAEGLAVESYLDIGDRSAFLNAEGPIALHPVFGGGRPDVAMASEALAYAPLCVTGAQVARLRAHLEARAESDGTAASRVATGEPAYSPMRRTSPA